LLALFVANCVAGNVASSIVDKWLAGIHCGHQIINRVLHRYGFTHGFLIMVHMGMGVVPRLGNHAKPVVLQVFMVLGIPSSWCTIGSGHKIHSNPIWIT